MITTIVVVLVIYFGAMVAIGFMGRDKASNFEGYLSMGRSAGILLLMGGAIGGNIGNGFVVGGAAEGASVGMAGSAYGIACALSAAGFAGMMLPLLLGMVTDQPTYQRINSAKSAKISRIACYLSCLVMIPLALMPAFIGSYGAFKYNATGNSAFFDVILNELPAVVCALIIAAVLAAVMSTIDCGLITMSTVLTRDIWQGAMKKNPSEEQLKVITLVVNIGFMVTSTILALTSSSILGLLNSVYAFLAASCFVPFVGGVLWKRGNATGAAAASLVGVVVVVLGMVGISLPGSGFIPGAILPIIPSAIAYIIVSLCTKPAAEAV